MRLFLAILVLVTLQNVAKANDNISTILTAFEIAQSFDNLYGDTVSESGDIKTIDTFKAFSVTFKSGEVGTVTLINDYETLDGIKSTLKGIATGSELEIESFKDIKTGAEI